MIYLLAKYALLFFIVAISGFAFGNWVTRRKYVDVTDSYEDLRKAADRTDAASWDRLWGRLDVISEPKPVDLSDVSSRLDSLASTVSNLPKPDRVNITPIEDGMTELKKIVRAIPIPFTPKTVDLEPIANKLARLEDKINALPSPKEPTPIDLAPLVARLDKVDQAIQRIPTSALQREPNLAPIQTGLTTLREQIKRMPVVETHQAADLKPIDRRLGAIEQELRSLGRRRATPPAVRDTTTKTKRSDPTILSAALYGKKDDLRLILGIGPKLERLLNKNGVYYFWQLADWTKQDISVMDERLDTFKGRIGRDDWVSQAKQLRRQAGAAQQPETP